MCVCVCVCERALQLGLAMYTLRRMAMCILYVCTCNNSQGGELEGGSGVEAGGGGEPVGEGGYVHVISLWKVSEKLCHPAIAVIRHWLLALAIVETSVFGQSLRMQSFSVRSTLFHTTEGDNEITDYIGNILLWSVGVPGN